MKLSCALVSALSWCGAFSKPWIGAVERFLLYLQVPCGTRAVAPFRLGCYHVPAYCVGESCLFTASPVRLQPRRECQTVIVFVFVFVFSVLVCSGSSLRVVNLHPSGFPVSFSNSRFPSGVTSLDLSSAPASLISSLSSDFGVSIDPALDYTVHVSDPAVPVFTVASGESNYWAPTVAGMGAGFLWFGFGWILRLGKKIPEF